jgi:DNA-binding NarL/FixJ family response regulator
VPGLRGVLVTVPHLLADIIRHVLTSRAGLCIVAEIADPESASKRLCELAPDVVIIGFSGIAQPLNAAAVRALLPHATVLVLSADLTQLLGPGENDIVEFTADTLAARLRR